MPSHDCVLVKVKTPVKAKITLMNAFNYWPSIDIVYCVPSIACQRFFSSSEKSQSDRSMIIPAEGTVSYITNCLLTKLPE